MPTSQTYYCTDCRGYKQAYSGEPNRCWSCDRYSLIRNDLTISQTPGQSLVTTQAQRAQVASEMANWCSASGNRYEYEAKVEVTDKSASFAIKCRPFIPPKN